MTEPYGWILLWIVVIVAVPGIYLSLLLVSVLFFQNFEIYGGILNQSVTSCATSWLIIIYH